MGLKLGEFYNMTWGNYHRVCVGYQIIEQNKYRHTRLLLSCWSGKDARVLIPLPGDWDNVPAQYGMEKNKEILSKHGIDKILDELANKN